MSPLLHDSTSSLLQLPNTYRAFYGSFPYLYPIQKRAIEPLLEGKDLIVQSATGSGKTEAVLAPCMERVIQSGREQAVLYVVPTRALAVDLERRLAPVLAERLGLRMGVRTGDLKRAGGARPDLLLTTPESLDVTLGSSNADLRGFVQRIGTVIIDEVHPLIYRYRGRQLAYLLQRLERRTAGPVQKVALSATIADVDAVVRFFGFGDDAVRLTEPVQREIAPHFVHLKNDEHELVALLDDLYDVWDYRKVLVFANSRSCCDRLFSLLSHHGRFQGVTELHYSNLKSKERRGVEHRFRRRAHALCIATSTLELGIDIGDVDGVLLYEPPDSASAFLQRIGRSNRREACTHFWGICRGEEAEAQLFRFLGLLRLARQGIVESPQPRDLPSVLVQQVLSCLYEKKRISLSALQALFPDRREAIDPLFASMVRQGWLREDRTRGLFRGGRRYRDCFLERRIWSNFPEAEVDYTLELSGEAIADLPKSVVRQLEPGDRVQLAGKRLQVLKIEAGERRHVVARPVDRLDEKELFWLGAGFRISYEVAQSIREVFRAGAEAQAPGLFARTRRLLETALDRAGRRVVLDNGIEVGRGVGGLYRYWTYLGSVGNLVLQWTVEHDLSPRPEDLTVVSDEVGIDCSHRIDFQTLSLPTEKEAFSRWTERHLEALCGLFPLNAFCAVLPRALLVEELTDFLFDCRIAEVFRRYSDRSSEVVSGDPTVLEQEVQEAERRTPVLFDTAPGVDALLTGEKQRWGIGVKQDVFAFGPDARHRPRTLTGTMVGAYLGHQQCERWLSLNFMPPDQRPPEWRGGDTDSGALRMERGRLHERRVLDHIRDSGEALSVVEEIDADGRRHSLKARFEASLEQLKCLVHRVESEPDRSFVLAQAVLILPSVLGREDDWLCGVDGVGIPDLIRVSMGDRGPLIEVGDIKDSRMPYDSQKWQVAFYALMLKALIRPQVQAEVAASGFLMLRPRPRTEAPEQHRFDLQPYLAAFPMLFRNVGEVLLKAPSEATYRLRTHCTTCPNFEHCYREALGVEDVLFLPQLTAGALQKFRALGLKTVEAAGAWFERPSQEPVEGDLFSPHQRELLEGRLTALRTNRIGLRERKTRLFPDNLSTAIFIHLIEDPISGLPRGAGWRALRGGTVVDGQVWVDASEGELPQVLQAFTERFLKVWEESVEGGQGPHVFHFGERCWQALQVWGEATELAFLWAHERTHRTDLRRLVGAHFDLPAPGNLTLFSLGRLLGLKPELREPESLFHADDAPCVLPEEWARNEGQRREMAERVDAILTLQAGVWRWASSHLESEWEQRGWEVVPGVVYAPETPYLNFLEEEKRLREEDILTLQAYTLEERVERFRAMGPLRFQETALDDEGRFLYGFETDPEAGVSKFREGDFLKLAPVGTPDLQSGFPVILAADDRNAGRVWVHSRQGRLALNRRLVCSLEEDVTDWNGPKLVHAVRTVFSADRPHPLSKLFSGGWSTDQDPEGLRWAQNWLGAFGPVSGLNPTQQQALALPFQYRVSLIEGPPGTGKTHLLGWTLIALIQQAREVGVPLRIVVSALTHQAIDQVLQKVVTLVRQHGLQDFPGKCLKWGRWEGEDPAVEGGWRVEPLDSVEALAEYPYVILGATGFGLYQMFEGRKGAFPQVFDRVVFDEASQVLIPQALLSLIYGKGKVLFYGDVKQLPPVVLGDYGEDAGATFDAHRSVLSHLLDCYGPACRVRLDQTYRMNEDLCAFPSRTWYDGTLVAAADNAHSRLVLSDPRQNDLLDCVLDPEKPVSLLVVDHRGCHQKSDPEVEIVTELAYRLMSRHGLTADQLALISPHRAQNNATADRLGRLLVGETLPLIDTVERVQGAERDVILFAFTASDPDHITSHFLNNPNRFNVAITRARQKLIVVGSRMFFSTVPQMEEDLKANRCFKAFYEFCRERSSLFFWRDRTS